MFPVHEDGIGIPASVAQFEEAAAQAADHLSRHQFLVLAESYLTLARSAEFLSRPVGRKSDVTRQPWLYMP